MSKQDRNQDPLGFYTTAIAELTRGAASPQNRETLKTSADAKTRPLEIVFYGMACFDPLTDGTGYRVLFPNGLVGNAEIPTHSAGVWIRPRNQATTAQWGDWLAYRNDYFMADKRPLTITGLAKTPLDASAFEGLVINIEAANPGFKISDTPDAVIEMIVDRGTLTAHVVNSRGMIVTQWVVQVEAEAQVRFDFGDHFVDIPPSATQVFLANAGISLDTDAGRHFQLYRRIAADPDQELKFLPPVLKTRSTTFVPDDPTFGYIGFFLDDDTPEVTCSSVQTRLMVDAVKDRDK